jgi:hypothetical protein
MDFFSCRDRPLWRVRLRRLPSTAVYTALAPMLRRSTSGACPRHRAIVPGAYAGLAAAEAAVGLSAPPFKKKPQMTSEEFKTALREAGLGVAQVDRGRVREVPRLRVSLPSFNMAEPPRHFPAISLIGGHLLRRRVPTPLYGGGVRIDAGADQAGP